MATETLPTLRERKKARTRDALIESAMELFREQGFDHTTVDQIVEPVEVSRRTFFRYFPTKEAVAFSHHADHIALFRELLAEHRDDGRPMVALRAATVELAKRYMRERALHVDQNRIVLASPSLVASEREIDLEWERAVAEVLVPAGSRDRRLDRRTRVLAGAAIGAFRATLREWFETSGKSDLVALATETLDALESGFAPRRGRR